MGRVHFLRAFIFTFFTLAITHIGPAAAATPAEEIIADWFQSLKDAGATVAKYDAVRVDAATDTATVENMHLEWQFGFGEASPATALVVTASQVVFVGLRQETDGYRIKSISVSDDYQAIGTGKDANGIPVVVKARATGQRSDGIFFPFITAPADDPQHPVSKFLHYYDLFLKIVTVKSSLDTMTVEQMLNDEVVSQIEYNGLVALGMQNGRIEEVGLKSLKQIAFFPKNPNSANNNAPVIDKMVTTYGELIQRGLDIRVLVDALIGKQDDADGDYKVFSEDVSMSDMKIVAGPATMSIADYRIAGLKVRPGKMSLFETLDRLALGEKPDEKQSIALAFDVLRRFALDEWSISGMQGSGPPNFSGRMGRMLVSGLSNEGLGQFSIAGVEGNGPSGEKLSFDRISIGKVLFPDHEDIIAAINNGPPDDPVAAAALGPKIGEIEVSKLYLDDRTKPALSLDLLKVLQSAFIGPIPTDIRIETRDLSLPVEYIDDAVTQNILRALGYHILKIASDIVLKWDEASQDLTLEKADLSLENGGKVSLKAGVAGLPKSVIENPILFEQALATLAFKNVNLSVRDADLVSGLIAHFAGLQKVSPADLRASLLQTLELQAGPLAGTPFLNEAKAALGAFMEDPQRLSVDLAPEAPVPFTQILGTAATAPDQTPGLLGAMISAN